MAVFVECVFMGLVIGNKKGLIMKLSLILNKLAIVLTTISRKFIEVEANKAREKTVSPLLVLHPL